MTSWGGSRPGSGRKKKAEVYGPEITALERRIADRLPQILDNLILLADGGFEQVNEVYEPAGLIQITKEIVTAEGTVNVKERAFPDLPPEQLVCVRRTRSIAAPDRAANIYLMDRIVGKPVAAIEVEAEVQPGDALVAAFGAVVAKIYGDAGGDAG